MPELPARRPRDIRATDGITSLNAPRSASLPRNDERQYDPEAPKCGGAKFQDIARSNQR
jgi:hypothetical protein